MKREIKVGIIVAIVEGVVAFIFGYILFLAQQNTIEQKTVETLAGYFESVDETMSYDEVLKTIYEDSCAKDNKIAELTTQLDELQEQFSKSENAQSILESAESFANSSDYKKALGILNSAVNKTPQMEVLISDYQKKYESQIIAEADELVSEKKYDEAIECISDALKIIPNSTVLAQKKDAVIASEPQPLMNILSPYESRAYNEKVSSDFMEMGGNKYYNGFTLGYNGYAFFNLDAKYTEIIGMIGHIDGSGNDDMTLTITGDGVLIKTIEIGSNDLPDDLSIPVTGVKQLKIEASRSNATVGFADLTIH